MKLITKKTMKKNLFITLFYLERRVFMRRNIISWMRLYQKGRKGLQKKKMKQTKKSRLMI